MSITENVNRIAHFTSSNIYKLMTKGKGQNGFGAPAITYIEEVILEKKLNRSISPDTYSRDMAWGTLLETWVSKILIKEDEEYKLLSEITIEHQTIKYWSGSTDMVLLGKKIGEIKCYQPKNFAKYAEALMKCDTNYLKENFAKEYWQLVSNAIINQVPIAEAILYMPYASELVEIADFADDFSKEAIGDGQWKYRFVAESDKSALAYLPDNSPFFKNLNRFEFEVPMEDKEVLTAQVLLAGSML
jgi:hypothetical protein